MTRLLVTGGAGFIGSHFVRLVLRERPEWTVVNLDLLAYSGNLDNLGDVRHDRRHVFIHGDVADAALADRLAAECDAIVHLAAESHVDRSIADPAPFTRTNVLGTHVLLEAARRAWGAAPGTAAGPGPRGRFVYASTDEVYGSLPLDLPSARFTEESPLAPSSPYAATKAAGDLLARAYHETYGLPTLVARCTNNLGPNQFPEKVIPLFVTNLLEGRPVPVYGDGRNVRDWIHVADHCSALLAILERGRPGRVYNVASGQERSNLELTREILRVLGRDESWIRFVPDRPGHDRRYALDTSVIRAELGWTPTRSAWPGSLEETVRWYAQHPDWWKRARAGAYGDWYRRQYGDMAAPPSSRPAPGPAPTP